VGTSHVGELGLSVVVFKALENIVLLLHD